MFRRRREKKAMKEAAKKAKKAEEEAAKNIQLVRVAPRGTQYGESPDFPLATRSRSMDMLNGDVQYASRPVQITNEVANGKKKKGKLRRAQSLAEDGMLAQSPQERYRQAHMQDGPVFYYNGHDGLAPVYVIDDPSRRGNGHVHPNTRPRYVVGLPPQHSLDPTYLSPGTPVLYTPQQSLTFNQQQHEQYQVPTTPEVPSTPVRAARSRNVQVIPKPGQEVKRPPKQRPVSQFYPTMRPTSTPLRTPSPVRTPSPAIFNTTPRNKGKGKAIRIVEGWDEPEDESPNIVQSHEVGVAPKSKVMDDFMNRNSSSPFSITINDKNASVTPSSNLQMREPSRRNKARPVSAAPWAMISEDSDYQPKTDSIPRQNGHSVVDFTE